jgi:hypothetical protein
MFANSTATWSQAFQNCTGLTSTTSSVGNSTSSPSQNSSSSSSNNNNIHYHMLAIETLSEAVSVSFWFKGQNYSLPYWIGGYFNSNTSLWTWNYLNAAIVFSSYISNQNILTNPYLYLNFNSTQQYEYASIDGSQSYRFICEAQSIFLNLTINFIYFFINF